MNITEKMELGHDYTATTLAAILKESVEMVERRLITAIQCRCVLRKHIARTGKTFYRLTLKGAGRGSDNIERSLLSG